MEDVFNNFHGLPFTAVFKYNITGAYSFRKFIELIFFSWTPNNIVISFEERDCGFTFIHGTNNTLLFASVDTSSVFREHFLNCKCYLLHKIV